MASSAKVTWQSLLAATMYGFMYFPIIVLAVYSFNASRYSAGWEGFSLKWYRSLFQDQRIFSALIDSLTIAFVAVGVSAVLGTMMAIGLAKYRFRGKGLYRGVAYLPLIIPDIAIAVATLVFLTSVAVPLSLGTIIVSHIVFCLAYIAVVVSSRLQNLDPNLEEAALDLGANPFQAMVRVLIPQLAPGILAGCLLAFVLSMDDLLISSFTAGGGANPLPLEIFSRVRTGVKPDINALSVVLITASALISGAAEYLRYRSERRQRELG
ncbi:MAG TPA: ABC transporter permease [Leptolyngbyaceae cyanobacterium M65_K2018_010]|nr:ABC transporter permease [Leptolyngbyaceae cyanobacterium M65_K2018_010]